MTERLKLGCGVTGTLLHSIQEGALRYSYRGIPMIKDPFSLALYSLLLWETKPRTIIEIGTDKGGSALWFSDQMRIFDIAGHVHSIDIEENSQVPSSDMLTFHIGDANVLDQTLSSEFMMRIARPLLVIEDSSHMPETTLAVLQFFDPWLGLGEYVVVEDGNVPDIYDAVYGNGPCEGIARFLEEHPNYEIDQRYCDFFGTNVTWHPNGFLRKRLIKGWTKPPTP